MHESGIVFINIITVKYFYDDDDKLCITTVLSGKKTMIFG